MKGSQCRLYENTCLFDMELESDTERYEIHFKRRQVPALKPFILKRLLCALTPRRRTADVIHFLGERLKRTEKKSEAWIRSCKKREILCQTGRCIKGPIYFYILVISSPPELIIHMKGWSAGGSVQDNLQTNLIDPSVLEKCRLTRSFRNKQFTVVNKISASPLR